MNGALKAENLRYALNMIPASIVHMVKWQLLGCSSRSQIFRSAARMQQSYVGLFLSPTLLPLSIQYARPTPRILSPFLGTAALIPIIPLVNSQISYRMLSYGKSLMVTIYPHVTLSTTMRVE